MLRKWLFSTGFLACLFLLPAVLHAQVIHEVQSGDTLAQVAKQYGYPVSRIAKLNGLAPQSGLVLGQALLLPGTTYIVQPGDSLYDIAARHSVSQASLKKTNGLKSSAIDAGRKLTIPHLPKVPLWNGSYLVPKDKYFNEWIIDYYRETLTSAFVFEYAAKYNGTLKAPAVNQANTIAWRKGVTPYATISNISEKGFDPALARHLMGDPGRRARFIDNVYAMLHAGNYKGVVIDFEQVWPKDRANLNEFIRRLSLRLHPHGMEVLIAVPPKEGDRIPSYSAGYDYRTLGKYVDKMFLMTYDWHWPGGPSGPIAPIEQVRQTALYAMSVMPKSKIMLGIPQYAYDWTLTDGAVSAGSAYSVQHATDLYTGHQSPIRYDEQAAAPTFRYTDAKGRRHEVWFEDPRSLNAKFHLVKELGIYGIGCWHLGLTMPQTEEILMEQFKVKH